MLLIPVTLRQESNYPLGSERSICITACCLPDNATVQDFTAAVGLNLGPEAAVSSCSYRGCTPASTGLLLKDYIHETNAPRFQISYRSPLIPVRVSLPDGRELQLHVRDRSSLEEVHGHLRAALGDSALVGHRLVSSETNHPPRLPLYVDANLTLEKAMSIKLTMQDGESHELQAWPSETPRDLFHHLKTKDCTCSTADKDLILGTKRLRRSAILRSGGVQDRSVLRMAPQICRDINISVKCITGRVWSFAVEPDMLLSGVKELVRNQENIPLDQQRFLHKGPKPADDITLQEHGMQDGAEILLILRLRGGGGAPVSFTDVSNAGALNRHSFNSSAPSWRQSGHGLNIEGRCTRRTCAAYKHRVIAVKGMCCFSLLADVAYCPLCQQSIIPTTCAFVGCAWMYDGRKLEPDNSVTCCSSEWEAVSDDFYHRFKEGGNMTDWLSLIISVRADKHETCSICWEGIWGEVTSHPACKHGFHKDCLAAWQRYVQAATCPLCQRAPDAGISVLV